MTGAHFEAALASATRELEAHLRLDALALARGQARLPGVAPRWRRLVAELVEARRRDEAAQAAAPRPAVLRPPPMPAGFETKSR